MAQFRFQGCEIAVHEGFVGFHRAEGAEGALVAAEGDVDVDAEGGH